jgi:hypothetical protein
MDRRIVLSCIVVMLVSLLLAIQFRFELVAAHPGGAHGGFGVVYRLDRWTGKVVALNGAQVEVLNLNEWEDVPAQRSSTR